MHWLLADMHEANVTACLLCAVRTLANACCDSIVFWSATSCTRLMPYAEGRQFLPHSQYPPDRRAPAQTCEPESSARVHDGLHCLAVCVQQSVNGTDQLCDQQCALYPPHHCSQHRLQGHCNAVWHPEADAEPAREPSHDMEAHVQWQKFGCSSSMKHKKSLVAHMVSQPEIATNAMSAVQAQDLQCALIQR